MTVEDEEVGWESGRNVEEECGMSGVHEEYDS